MKASFLKGTNETKKCLEESDINFSNTLMQHSLKTYIFIIGSTFSIIIESTFK